MEIRWMLDEPADEGLSILGELSLIAGDSQIHEECIFLDSWFYTMLEAMHHLKSEADYDGDLIEEPDHLYFSRSGNAVMIRYKGNTINTDDSELIKALKSAAQTFLYRARQIPGAEKNPVLDDIQKLIASV